jgi:hypothetical protein
MHECDHGFESVSRQEAEKSNGYGYGHVVSAKPCSKVAPVLLSFFLLPWFLFFFDISQELNIRTLAATNPSSAAFHVPWRLRLTMMLSWRGSTTWLLEKSYIIPRQEQYG